MPQLATDILSCPVEIFWKIFLELVPDAHSIRICRLVCRAFHQGIESSLQLQVFLKCDAWGYRQPSFGIGRELLTMSDYSSRLDAHVRSWRNLDWRESRVQMSSPHDAYTLAQGVFAYASNETLDLPRYSITCITLPSRIMDTEAITHTLDDIGFLAKDLAIDPSQDLLVILELREEEPVPWGSHEAQLHILQLSNGLQHPEATNAIINTEYTVSDTGAAELVISGSRIGFMWRDKGHDTLLEIWDWRSGALLWTRMLYQEVDTYRLIAPDLLLVPGIQENEQMNVEMWKIAGLYPFGSLRSTFALPHIADTSTSRVVLGGDSSPPADDDTLATRRSLESSLSSRMIRLDWMVEQEDGLHQRHIIVARLEAFLDDYGYAPREPIPYFVWSSGNVHVLQEQPNDTFAVSSGRQAQIISPSVVEITDFIMPRYYFPPSKDGLATGEHIRTVRPPFQQSAVSEYEPPDNDFQSYSQSYWKQKRDIGFRGRPVAQVLIDEEHIILLQHDQWRTECDLTILTL